VTIRVFSIWARREMASDHEQDSVVSFSTSRTSRIATPGYAPNRSDLRHRRNGNRVGGREGQKDRKEQTNSPSLSGGLSDDEIDQNGARTPRQMPTSDKSAKEMVETRNQVR